MDALPASTPVLVIGGGPVGLVTSLLLSQRGISHVVLERRRETQRAPAAHVIRRRPMEILDSLGVGDAVRRAAPPLALDCITWCTTLGGAEVGRLCFREPDPESGETLPDIWTNCPQNVLEPILMRAAEARPEARVWKGAECVALEQEADRVRVRIRRDAGAEQSLEATLAVAADGAGSPVRRMLDIEMEGPGPLARFAMVHFEADLRPWISQREGPLFWILNPQAPGTLIVHDPVRSHVFMTAWEEGRGEDDTSWIAARLEAALGIPLAPKMLSVDRWSPHVQVASRYREGRVLLVGDAAHRFPPTGGLGMNTGIQEAPVLVDALAAVLEKGASLSHLDVYEKTCRPVAQSNADDSFENLKRLFEIHRVIGHCEDLPALERRLASLSEAERRELDAAIEAQRSHFTSDGSAAPGLGASA